MQEQIVRRRLSCSLKSIVFLILCVLLCSSLCAGLLTWIQVNLIHNPTFSYAIVFDAGSSHTHMMIFRWLGSKSDGRGGTALIHEIHSKELKPGLQTLINKGKHLLQKEVKQYFEPFFNDIKIHVPKEKRKDASLLLGATAGMRLSKIEQPKHVEALLESIRKCFRAHGFIVTQNSVRIITGLEEAVSAWITVNILTSRIRPNRKVLDSYGALDLGGASSQIAFATNAPNNTINLKLFGHKYTVGAYSFLCLGKDEIRNYIDYKLIRNSKLTSIYDPCSLRGNIRKVSKFALQNKPCILGLDVSKWQKPKLEQNRRLYKFIGSGEPDQCHQLIQSVVIRQCNAFQQCLFNHTHPMHPFNKKMKFIGFAGFYYVWNNLGQPKSTDEYLTKLFDYCNDQSDTESNSKYNLCFDGWYIYVLLKAYGFDDLMQQANIERYKKLNGKSVGWAYGFMINQTNIIPETYPQFTQFYLFSHKIAMALMWTIAFICLCLFVLLCCRIKACEK